MELYTEVGGHTPPNDTNSQNFAHGALLSERHRKELEASAISPEVVDARGYSTVAAEEALELGFSKEQARDGLLIPLYTPDGEVSYQLKPDSPRAVDGKMVKYETRAGCDITLDVHPGSHRRLLYTDEPILVTEGIKKADCAASHGRLALGLSGVWNWGRKRKRGGAKYGRPELLPDWDAVPLEGRKVHICFDADYRDKQNVALAILRLSERLTERGAHVYILSLPGPEKGLDDYVVAGGSLDALLRDTRPFTASDLTPYTAKPDKRILGAVEATMNAMRLDRWDKMKDKSAHSVLRALLELALEGGGVVDGEVEVVVPSRELRRRSSVGSKSTMAKADANLVERGYVEKESGDWRAGRANRYRLKLSETVPLIGTGYEVSTNPIPGTPLVNFVPHLRWASPTSSATDGDERDSELPKPGDSPVNFPHERPEPKSAYGGEPIRDQFVEAEQSLGKTVELAIHLLNSWGGASTLRDLSTATGVNHTSKMRCHLVDLVEAGVIGMDEKGKHGARVWLMEDWRKGLDRRRESGGEIRRARAQAVRDKVSRYALKAYHETDEEGPLMGKTKMQELVEKRWRDEAMKRAIEAEELRLEAEAFVSTIVQNLGRIRFGMLSDMWVDDRGGTHSHADWLLRKAIGELGYVLRPAEGDELFVYPAKLGKATVPDVAAPSDEDEAVLF